MNANAVLPSEPMALARAVPRIACAVAVLGLLAGCGVVDAAGSVVGGAVDLTVDAVDTTTDVITAPF